ncbi:MAG: hypothetical protein DYG94_06020 [Leptolyngbya sp. PLA3]|nr:MAG: hypothetical protein EDM82_03550 [Cyanobacteria bacterium CYA]MCE7968285.1 hypothetical protein [Leptolyngbya sp. PL-A3]
MLTNLNARLLRMSTTLLLSVCGAATAESTLTSRETVPDSADHTSLQNAAAVGHDGRFFLARNDGTFRLQIAGELQFRYYGTFNATSSVDDYESGFQHNRTRLEFRGNVIDPRLTYRILTNFNRETGVLELQDAYAEYELENNTRIRWGQFKLPFDRESFATGPTSVQGVEASVLSSIFRLDRSQGIMLNFQAERWQIHAALSDVRRALNTAYQSGAEAEFALTGRAEFRLGHAPWKQFRDQTAFRGDKTGFLIGLGGHWQQEGATGAPASTTGTVNLYQCTIDVGFEADGWNALAAYTGRVFDGTGDSVYDSGGLIQAGVFVSEKAELFARYTHLVPDDDRTGGHDDFAAVTGGLNWYFIPSSHALKFTGEVTWYPDPQADSASLVKAPDTAIGLLGDSDGGQFTLGLQMQLLF